VPRSQEPERTYPVKLTQAQRKVVAEVVPELAERLKLDEPDQRTIEFTVAELKIIQKKATADTRLMTSATVKAPSAFANRFFTLAGTA